MENARQEVLTPLSEPRHIVSASRRTDVPAFYSRWLLRRLEQGFCDWIHPFGGAVRRVSLRPEDCLAIVFWTRNPAPLIPALEDISASGHTYYFQYTITGYPRSLEARTPNVRCAIRTFHEAARSCGPEAMIWRYDPIVMSSATPAELHVEAFGRLAAELSGATRRAYVSFVDYYGKTRKGFEHVAATHGVRFEDPDDRAKKELVLRLRDLAHHQGMTLYACCEDSVVGEGVEKGHCVDLELVRKLRPDAEEPLKRRPTRKQCGCTESVDVGAYDSCPFGCRYCYATRERSVALTRFGEHDPEDTLLWRPPRLRTARGT